jgi:hypothetical protein
VPPSGGAAGPGWLAAAVSTVTVTVTWTDGRQETYRTQRWAIRDGELCLWSPNDIGVPNRHIPLAGVRIWTEER